MFRPTYTCWMMVFITILSFTARGQITTDLQAHSLSLQVKAIAQGGASVISPASRQEQVRGAFNGVPAVAQTDTVTEERERANSSVLEFHLRNLGQDAGAVKVEWYFVGRAVQGGSPAIFDAGTKDLTLPAAGWTKFEIGSAPLRNSFTREVSTTQVVDRQRQPLGSFVQSAKPKRDGAKATGWIVRLFVGGKLVQVQASAPMLAYQAQDDRSLARFARFPVEQAEP